MKTRQITALALGLILAACTQSASPSAPTQENTPTVEPSAPTPGLSAPAEITNLALHAPVSASAALPEFPAEHAVDGIVNISLENWWGAGDFPSHWIEIDLGGPTIISEIRLLTSQSPAGLTTHRIWGCNPSGDLERLHEIRGETRGDEWLEYSPPEAWLGYSCLRIETIQSPSWVAWREIEIFGFLQTGDLVQVSPTASPDEPTLVFHNGQVISMEAGLPIYQAIAIAGSTVLALGNDTEILDLAAPSTTIIDLRGLTIMPGFVDPHTHFLKDSGLSIAEAQQALLEQGFTTVTEMSATPEFLDEIASFANSGQLRIRTSIYMQYTDPCGELLGDWYQDYSPGQEFGDSLRITGVKLFADGGVCGLPAVSFEYPTLGGHGDLWFSQEQMTAAITALHQQGYQVAVHAQGDTAIEQVQNAFEAVFAGQPNDQRHRIEHNSFHRADLLPRYTDLGIVPTIFGAYATCAENQRAAYSTFFGSENLSWLENWRDFVDANPDLPIAWHGDDPWVVPLSPILELFGLVTRAEVAEDGSVCIPPDWLASHAITVEEALPFMTINAAYALFRDDEVGSLEPGKLADLVILSANPLAIDLYEIKDLEVWLTMVGGNTEFCASSHADLCP